MLSAKLTNWNPIDRCQYVRLPAFRPYSEVGTSLPLTSSTLITVIGWQATSNRIVLELMMETTVVQNCTHPIQQNSSNSTASKTCMHIFAIACKQAVRPAVVFCWWTSTAKWAEIDQPACRLPIAHGQRLTGTHDVAHRRSASDAEDELGLVEEGTRSLSPILNILHLNLQSATSTALYAARFRRWVY